MACPAPAAPAPAACCLIVSVPVIMLPSVCCLADARLVRLFPAVGRWGSSGLLAVLATPAAETKKPRNRLLGCVAKRWLAPRKVHAVLDRVKLLQQGRCRQEKPRKEASLCLPHLAPLGVGRQPARSAHLGLPALPRVRRTCGTAEPSLSCPRTP